MLAPLIRIHAVEHPTSGLSTLFTVLSQFSIRYCVGVFGSDQSSILSASSLTRTVLKIYSVC
jgi:hypothetical protein